MYAPTSLKSPDNRQIFTGFVGATLCGCPSTFTTMRVAESQAEDLLFTRK